MKKKYVKPTLTIENMGPVLCHEAKSGMGGCKVTFR